MLVGILLAAVFISFIFDYVASFAVQNRLESRLSLAYFAASEDYCYSYRSHRQHCCFPLFAKNQQLGKFETLDVNENLDASDEEGNPRVRRYVRVYDFSILDPIEYRLMWDVQKELVGHHVERLKVEFQKPKLTPESQFLPPESVSESLSDINFQKSSEIDRTDRSEDEVNKHHAVSLVLNDRIGRGRDSLILLQHNAVYTLGTGSDPSYIKLDEQKLEAAGIDLLRIERGGEVTYHGPGQLTAYPILDLRGYNQDIHWYMRALEEAILIALHNVGVHRATREDDVTGVWVDGKKVAALGVKVRRWVTMHGLAVNVDSRSLGNFEGIVPCGLEGRKVACINDFLVKPITVDAFSEHLKAALEQVFEFELIN